MGVSDHREVSMSLGSISSSTVSAAVDAARLIGGKYAEGAKNADGAKDATIADHVAAADDHEPIRSLSATQGTLIDTYL
jgi:hypothetical protein